ncbi:MAG: pyridoxine 5'-phosphate synthase [Acidiferrobacterales bacterium]|nr:pyridoxine 5'-phosphate synthase [Acidiferrobacterales bacterium]
MTNLSVNLNKIALLRNSRGRDYPNLKVFAEKFIELGVHGLTIHPRQDQRHITTDDALMLGELLNAYDQVELNIEGYPSESFLKLIETTRPEQCTFVPDSPNQLTSDHGWDLSKRMDQVALAVQRVKSIGVRTALFLDPDLAQLEMVPNTGADRIELYTENYACAYQTGEVLPILKQYKMVVGRAQELGIGINAGHDLDLQNLKDFLGIGPILEVSIGHALITECIESGLSTVVSKYLEICNG